MSVGRRIGEIPTDDPSAWVVAFYLPQFHPIPENDSWWGPGFTEWTKVRTGTPQFADHHQPRLPSGLGYYDLRDADVHLAQANLAREHGVRAFLYYAYYFNGRRLLEQPLDLVTASPDMKMPYAVCWANEPWTRRWDGSGHQVLMAQTHSPESDAGFVDAIAHQLADERYLRIRGRPLIGIYRAGILNDPIRSTDALRERSVRLGLGEPYLAMVQSFNHWDPREYGLDAAIEFPPHPFDFPPGERLAYESFRGRLFSYPGAARHALGRRPPEFPWFRGVMPDWDNTARRGDQGFVFTDSSPELFSDWTREVLEFTFVAHPPGERLLFVNAWNEWGEGAHLEPDDRHGDAYLRALSEALKATSAYSIATSSLFSSGSPDLSDLLEDARAGWHHRQLRSTGDEHAQPVSAPDYGHGEQLAVRAALASYRTVRRVRPVFALLRVAAAALRRLRDSVTGFRPGR